MLKQDLSYYDSFTDKTVTEYGILYHNALNPMSYDSNHAIITDFRDPDSAIRSVIKFYTNLDITPRLYHAYIDNELEILRPHLDTLGFTVKVPDSVFMLFPDNGFPLRSAAADIRQVRELTQDLIDLIHTEDAGDWSINVLKYHFKDDHFHLFGLFDQGKVVSQASLKIMNGYSSVSDVLTHKEYRGRHYGTELMKYMVDFHRAISTNYLYLWAENPVAIRMYQNVGFKIVDINKKDWMASLENTGRPV